MQGKARYIFAAIQSGIMAFLMTAIITGLNLGFPPDYVARWLKAFVIAWPCAFVAALVARPFAQAGTEAIVARLDKTP
jgi:Protein of unknown function (DUF2798)